MISKLRGNDIKLSDLVSEFLDVHFYSEMSNYQRINDIEMQVTRIDTIFDYNEEHYDCDEKAAVHYINKSLSTFSLELSFFNRINEEHCGWLLHDMNVNNSYLFVWIDKAKTNKPSNIDEFLDVEVSLVKKSKIMDYLNSLGWSKEKLLLKTDRIRKNEKEYLGDMYRDGFRFCKSFHLVERPINILLKRTKLKEMSDISKHFIF